MKTGLNTFAALLGVLLGCSCLAEPDCTPISKQGVSGGETRCGATFDNDCGGFVDLTDEFEVECDESGACDCINQGGSTGSFEDTGFCGLIDNVLGEAENAEASRNAIFDRANIECGFGMVRAGE
jgi:hypothetical protein